MCLECHQGWYKTDGNMVCTPDGTSPGGGSSGGPVEPYMIACPTTLEQFVLFVWLLT